MSEAMAATITRKTLYKMRKIEKSGKRWLRALVQIAAVIAIIILAVVVFKILLALRKPPEKKQVVELPPLVEVETVKPASGRMVVRGFGSVSPKIEVQVVPQVSGRVVYLSPDFVDGGFFDANEPLITIDREDYELAVQSAKADVAAAQVRLETEQAEAAVARQEWDQINPGKEPASPLVLREPQIRQAKASLQAAHANLAAATLSLERTVITMPFDGRVSDESVDTGQYITAGQSLATVYGTDVVEIVVPLEDGDLAWFNVPDGRATEQNPSTQVKIFADFAGSRHEWQGSIARTQGELDPVTRLVDVVVEVKDPFEIKDSRPPLVPGMFVETAIQGREYSDLLPIPIDAVRNGKYLWVVKEGILRIVELDIFRSDNEHAYAVNNFGDEVVVITSSMDIAVDGMKVRTEPDEIQR